MKSNNIISFFLEQAELNPAKIALESEIKSITFLELKKSVQAYSCFLKSKKIKEGSKVLILHPACPELFAAILALLANNCTIIFVEEWTGIKDIVNCCKNIKCDYILSNWKGRILKYFYSDLRSIPNIGLQDDLFEVGENMIVSEPADNHPAMISFSSGSSGSPKAVIRTHSILKAQFEALKEHIMLDKENKMYTNFPVVILLNLGLGVCTRISSNVKINDLKKSNIKRLYTELQRNKVSHLAFSPYLLRVLSREIKQSKKSALTFVQVITGGSPVFPVFMSDWLKAFNTSYLTVLYGSSEAEPIASSRGEDVLKYSENSGLYAGKIDKHTNCVIGRIQNGIFYPSKENEIGEILVKGEHVVKQYLNSELAFKRNKIKINNDIWHRTGDWGRLDNNSLLYLTGHPDHQYNGLCLLEIEKLLLSISGVEFATIINQIAFIQTFGKVPKAEVIKAVQEFFPELNKIQFVQMPLDRRHHGKIKYSMLNQNMTGHSSRA